MVNNYKVSYIDHNGAAAHVDIRAGGIQFVMIQLHDNHGVTDDNLLKIVVVRTTH